MTQLAIPSLKYHARRNNLLVPKKVITCRHISKYRFRDVFFKRRYTIITVLARCHFIAPGIADSCYPKALPNEKQIPTCVPYCYDVEKILIVFILNTSKYLLWQNSDDSNVSTNDTVDIFGQILNYIIH